MQEGDIIVDAERVLCGNAIYPLSVARERDERICAGRVCAGTGFHIYHGTMGFNPDPAQNRGINPAGKIPGNALVSRGPLGQKISEHCSL